MPGTIPAEHNDTICAVSTPAGTGGIAVIRISGPRAIAITDTIWQGRHRLADTMSHTARVGYITDPARADGDNILDQAVATVYRAPHSYTGEDTVELSVHGSRWIQRQLISLLIRQGCRVAEAGEYTRRALTAGHIDLAQAEAIADVISSSSRAAHRIAMSQMRGNISRELNDMRDQLIRLTALLELELDFSDQEDITLADRSELIALADNIHRRLTVMASTFEQGRAIKDGIPVAIIGPTNAGKSTLLNQMLGEQRAIVSDIHGTTRDTIEDTIEIGDYLYRLIDTAGIRDTIDAIERLGIERTRQAIRDARIILMLLDPADPATPGAITDDLLPTLSTLTDDQQLHILFNKSDLPTPADTITRITTLLGAHLHHPHTIHHISASTRRGLTPLLEHLGGTKSAENAAHQPTTPTDSQATTQIITNARHYQALTETASASAQVAADLRAGLPADLIAQPLRHAIHHLGTITGTITTPDILHHIFTHFCIGK